MRPSPSGTSGGPACRQAGVVDDGSKETGGFEDLEVALGGVVVL
ncbi:MAG: hypothetical protein NTW21_09305 [Verrucomicrobia bacterium]|nr:hypothetical protein [Verrucomicrobiota bacterium]